VPAVEATPVVPAVVSLLTTPVTTKVVITARPSVPVTVAVVTADTAASEGSRKLGSTADPTTGRPVVISTRAAMTVVALRTTPVTTTVIVTPGPTVPVADTVVTPVDAPTTTT
ncbi:hypothetical protein, partial [Streptomyces sp. SP18CM02]|uniref:hypothetical protein n=1 Tax=Streptomyces sp. SP18CM02 TaxID=2758571 RepID=UPI0019BC29C8